MKKIVKIKNKKNKDGTIDIVMTCKKCGQPIDHATDMGIFCKNMCVSRSNLGLLNPLKSCKLINKL